MKAPPVKWQYRPDAQERAMKRETLLERLRKEIQADTKLVSSEPERLERRRMEKLLGPLEHSPPQKARAKGKEAGLER
jgi:hypothetical protein